MSTFSSSNTEMDHRGVGTTRATTRRDFRIPPKENTAAQVTVRPAPLLAGLEWPSFEGRGRVDVCSPLCPPLSHLSQRHPGGHTIHFCVASSIPSAEGSGRVWSVPQKPGSRVFPKSLCAEGRVHGTARFRVAFRQGGPRAPTSAWGSSTEWVSHRWLGCMDC